MKYKKHLQVGIVFLLIISMLPTTVFPQTMFAEEQSDFHIDSIESIDQDEIIEEPTGDPEDFQVVTIESSDGNMDPEETGKPVANVTISPNRIELRVDEVQSLMATVLPADATNKAVTWESDNPIVATVDAAGNVRAMSPGTAIMTVTTVDGGRSASALVAVKETVKPTIRLSVEMQAIDRGDLIPQDEVDLKKGDTAFTVLQRITEERGISLDYSGFGATLQVRAIGNLHELDYGLGSSWMYSVNGVFPEYSASLYPLKKDDILKWQYTKDYGKDIGKTIEPVNPNQVKVPADRPFRLESHPNDDGTSPITMEFESAILPNVVVERAGVTLDIPQYTNVMNSWSNKIQAPTRLFTTASQKEKINTALQNKEVSLVNAHIKVGADQPIRFDRHVKIVFKNVGVKDAGFIDHHGNFTLIENKTGENGEDDVFSYQAGNDLVIKTKHFTDFLVFETIEKEPELPAKPDPAPEPEIKPEPTPELAFTDITGHWAADYIKKAVKDGIFNGYPDGTFRPGQPLTRAQAVSILVRSMKLETARTEPFTDTKNYAKETRAEIAAAYHYGLVNGKGDKFHPSQNVTRAQMALMLYRAYDIQNNKAYKAKRRAPFKDMEKYALEARLAVDMLYELGMASGENGNYMPSNPTTRAHAAKMLMERTAR